VRTAVSQTAKAHLLLRADNIASSKMCCQGGRNIFPALPADALEVPASAGIAEMEKERRAG